MRRTQRSTPAGEHRPVLLEQVLAILDPQPGQVVLDCTVGWAGHAVELLRNVGPSGRLICIDLDADNLSRARERLAVVGHSFTLHHGNFAGIQDILAVEGLSSVNMLLADLGMSSMQVDDVERGFSYVRDGPLDMRMDRSRGRTAADLLATMSEKDLAHHLKELGDEPEAIRIASAIVAARRQAPILRTSDLARVIIEAIQPGKKTWRLHPKRDRWVIHPAARTFQALRILVNRELANLQQLLRVLPTCLASEGRAAIISFHSGEDRLVKTAFREGLRTGVYGQVSDEPVRASFAEKKANPRSRSAKLRWACRSARVSTEPALSVSG
jgi:16S rRNA (cytosine1402-N4)-methyltransferase